VTWGRCRQWRRSRGKRGRSIRELFWEVVVKVDDGTVVGEDVLLGEAKLPGKDFEELSLYPVHVSLAKDTGGKSPVDVS